MSEDGSNSAFPQEDGQDGFQINSFLPPAGEPLPELVHCKVPLGAWLGESIVFGKRYFWRLFLLGFVASVLSLGFSSPYRQNPFMSCGTFVKGANALAAGSAALAADEGTDGGEEIDFFAPESESDADSEPSAQDEPQSAADEETDGGEEIDFFAPESESDANSESSAQDKPQSAAEGSPSAEEGTGSAEADLHEDTASSSDTETDACETGVCGFGRWKNRRCRGCCGLNSSICLALVSALWIFAVLFGLMSHLWGLRTVQKDDGSWRNLLFPSWKTFPKLILAWFILTLILFVIAFGFILLFSFLGEKLGPQFAAAGALLAVFIFIFVLLRFAITAHLILDRDYGPVKALNTSWEFMKSNAFTLLTGFILYSLTLFVLAMVVLIPLAFMLGNQDISDPDRLYQHILSTPVLIGTAAAAMILFNTLSQIGSIALASVFYLMATGQKRPGAWPRENV